jgi:hypothetical protein
VEPLWVGTKFKLEPSPGRHYNFNETIVNWINSFLACSAVPQPIAPPRLWNCCKNYSIHWFNVRTVHFRRSNNDQKYTLILPFLYSVYWLLHVSALACHYQGAS